MLCSRVAAVAFATLLATACGNSTGDTQDPPAPVRPSDRSDLANVGETDPLDYSDPRLWLCSPDSEPNACAQNLDATEVLPDGSMQLVEHVRATAPEFDCFYVYPTVVLDGTRMQTDFQHTEKVLDPLLSQAALFSSLCEVYAPLYRQRGISLTGSIAAQTVLNPDENDRGVQDIRDAFRYFLEHHSRGRKFVILGHSQGSAVLTTMIQKEIDPKPELRSRMISALLIGGGATVAPGERTGGSFQNIPTCSEPGETGCIVAYASFAAEAPPQSNALFGRASAGLEAACTDPAALSGNTDRLRGMYGRVNLSNSAFKLDGSLPSGMSTEFALYRQMFRSRCVAKGDAHFLEITVDRDAQDTRAVPPHRSGLAELVGFGMHVVDYAVPLDDLRETVRLQAEAALR